MKTVYHPPPWGRKSWLGFLQGLGLAAALFMLLPLTQYLASTEIEAPETRRVDTVAPPPPPPPPPPEEEPPVPAASTPTRDQIPEPARPEPPPLTLRQLELALDPDIGAAGQGDFVMNFDLQPGGIGDIDVFDVSEVDQAPRAVSTRQPRYPRELQRAGISGVVTLVFVVDLDGSVRNVEVEQADHRALVAPAMEAVRSWRFLPGEHRGEPVRVLVRQTLEFEVR